MSDWQVTIEDVAVDVAAVTTETYEEWVPAVRECWAYGLSEDDAKDVCITARYPHVVGPVLTVFTATKRTWSDE